MNPAFANVLKMSNIEHFGSGNAAIILLRRMRRFLVVRCKGCDADLIFREIPAGDPQRPYILGTGLARCRGCHQEHEYFDEDIRTIEASEES